VEGVATKMKQPHTPCKAVRPQLTYGTPGDFILWNQVATHTPQERNGFCPGRSYIQNVFILRELTGKKYNMSICTAFLDYENIFDRADHEKLCNILIPRGVPVHLLKTIVYMQIEGYILILYRELA
jgi:hypothetical protein